MPGTVSGSIQMRNPGERVFRVDGKLVARALLTHENLGSASALHGGAPSRGDHRYPVDCGETFVREG